MKKTPSLPFKRTPLYLAVCSALVLAPAISYVPKVHAETLEFTGDDGGGNTNNSGLTYNVTSSSGAQIANIPVYAKDPSDGVNAGSGYNTTRYIWTYSDGSVPANPEMTINVSGMGGTHEQWTANSTAPFDAAWIMGAFISSTQEQADYIQMHPTSGEMYPYYDRSGQTVAGSDGKPVLYSNFHDGVTLNINLAGNTTFASKLYGVRNDAGGGIIGDDYSGAERAGSASNNTVNIRLDENNAHLYAKLVFGGRSAQFEAEGLRKGVHAGFDTDYNRVLIDGGVTGISINDVNAATGAWGNYQSGRTSTIVSKGIFGGEGYQANNNLVAIQNTVLSAGSSGARKLGLVGGRGMYDFRIGEEAIAGGGQTHANNNKVIIQNSYVGYVLGNDNDWNKATDLTNTAFSVYGGWATGEARNNIVAAENSVINGDVIGGLEFKNQVQGGTQADGTTDLSKMRELEANLVSLHNVKLVGDSAIYGTATADGAYQTGTQIRLDEASTKFVNRRRGVAYLAGDNTVASAYVRYIHFGQYYDADWLQANYGREIDVSQSYYPTGGSASGALAGVHYTNDPNDPSYGEETIRLGRYVAGSHMHNTNGLHSDLSSKNTDQSDSTNGQHNFWIGAYVNLDNRVGGDGTKLDITPPLVKADGSVNHQYDIDNNLGVSLLAHDDGMVVALDKPLMDVYTGNHSIRGADGSRTEANGDGYYDGLVLYLNVNDGKDTKGNNIHAVDIDFSKIESFRQASGQAGNAFGNTQVGISLWGDNAPRGLMPTADGDTTTDLSKMAFDVSGFKIEQGGEHVADATYAFYKYLHFDGEYDSAKGTIQTPTGTPGGAGLAYWLRELDVLDGRQVVLYGLTDSEADDIKNNKKRYTLSTRVTGKGGLYIPENNTVVIGDENTYYYQTLGERNDYTGVTTVGRGATLEQGADDALGRTRKLEVASGAQYQLNGKSQTVGGLVVDSGATADFDSLAGTAGENGSLTVERTVAQADAAALINGEIKGADDARFTVQNGSLTVNSNNAAYLGEVNLNGTTRAELSVNQALANAHVTVDGPASLFLASAEGAGSYDRDGSDFKGHSHMLDRLTNSGVVYLSRQGEENHNTATLNEVAVNRYEGKDGTLFYKTRLNSDSSPTDFVYARHASGTGKVGVQNLPEGYGDYTHNGIHIFHTDNGGVTLREGGPIAASGYYYALEGRNDGDNGGKKDWYLVNRKDEVRAEAGGYVNNAQAIARMHMRLHDRMGQAYRRDPFSSEVKETAGWVRVVQDSTHYRMHNGATRTHADTAVIQAGSDVVRQAINEDWKYNLGAFGGALYGHAKTYAKYHANSKVDGYSLGVYGTLYTGNSPDDGFYVDSWLMWGRYHNSVYGSLPQFRYDSNGWVASLEVGKTFALGQNDGTAGKKDRLVWTLQPQAQVIWDGVKAGGVTDSTYTTYRQLGGDNVITRIGARLHANRENKGLGFIEANWIHNTRQVGVQMNSDRFYSDGTKDSGELRIGLEGHLDKDLLGWATLGYRAGRDGYHEETAQVGLKLMFD